jgi:hypothetical protein
MKINCSDKRYVLASEKSRRKWQLIEPIRLTWTAASSGRSIWSALAMMSRKNVPDWLVADTERRNIGNHKKREVSQWRHIKANVFAARFIWKFLANRKPWATAIALLVGPGPAVR